MLFDLGLGHFDHSRETKPQKFADNYWCQIDAKNLSMAFGMQKTQYIQVIFNDIKASILQLNQKIS